MRWCYDVKISTRKVRHCVSQNSLERICLSLPFASYLDPDLDTLVDILSAALVINPQLQDIPVLQLVWAALRVCGAEADVVEERAGRTLRVSDIELPAVFSPDLGMSAADDLGLEGKLVRAECVGRVHARPGAISEAADSQRLVALLHVASDGIEPERSARLEVRNEPNAVCWARGALNDRAQGRRRLMLRRCSGDRGRRGGGN